MEAAADGGLRAWLKLVIEVEEVVRHSLIIYYQRQLVY